MKSASPSAVVRGPLGWPILVGHLLVIFVLLPPPTGVAAQSLLAAEGLGVLVESLDARSRALGGAGLGLTGSYLLDRDPAAGAGLSIPGATATLQSSTTTLTAGGTAGYTRFPVIAVSYPYRGNVFSVKMGSFLDQEWEAQSAQTLDLGGDEVDLVDGFTSTGSVGRVSFGWARTILESAAVGVTFGSYVGTMQRVFTRSLDPEDVGIDVESFEAGGRLRASGVIVGAGVTWDPRPLLRVSSSILWSDDLTFSPTSDEPGEKGSYRIPLELRGGGTVTLTSVIALHLGLTFADWSDTGADLEEGTTRGGTWSYGGGLEWSGGTLLGRPIPIRLGARHRDLPFHSDGAPASERTLSGGFGLNLVDAEEQPLARIEMGIERGNREAGSVSEDFLRVLVSVRIASG